MNSQRWLGFILFTLLIGAGVWSTSHAAATTPTGTINLYMPQVGRAEPAPAEYLGLFYSRARTYAGMPPSPPITSEIYTVRGDGSGRTRLTNNMLVDDTPTWSPDGSLVLWRQYDGLGASSVVDDLWLMNTDGTNARNLTNLPGEERGSWAPTGATIAFVNSNPAAPDPEPQSALYLTTPDALTPTLVMTQTNFFGFNWSPDGTRLGFMKGDDFYGVNRDGSGLTLVAEGLFESSEWSWSPDGEWVAYEKEDGENLDIYVSRTDGSETRRLTTSAAFERFAGWVEGGTRILVSRRVDEVNYRSVLDLVTIADGTISPFVADDGTNNVSPVGISPNSENVVFKTQALYIQATDSLTASQISPDTCMVQCQVYFAGWSEDERQAVYTFITVYTPNIVNYMGYVANLATTPPTYTENGYGGVSFGEWLPYGLWLPGYNHNGSNADSRFLFNTRTLAQIPLPPAEDGLPLLPGEWRYQP